MGHDVLHSSQTTAMHAGVSLPDAYALVEEIAAAPSPEEAARLGRAAQKQRPHLVRPDWDTAKLFIMEAALRVKVGACAPPPGHASTSLA